MSKNTVFLTASDVRLFIHDYSFSRIGYRTYPEVFEELRHELVQLAKNFADEEEKFYEAFGKKSLKELQQEIDKINKSGLYQFANNYLTAADSSLKTIVKKTYDQSLYDGMIELLSSDIPDIKNITDEMTNEQLELIEAECVNKLRLLIEQGRKEQNQGGKGPIKVRGQKEKTGIYILAKNLISYLKDRNLQHDFSISPAYKKTIKLILKKNKIDVYNSSWEMIYQNPEEITDAVIPFNYYPYFHLTPEEAAYADNTKLPQWHNFVEHVKQVANLEDPSIVDAVMKAMGPKAFIKSDINGVVGILGELQMFLITAALRGGVNNAIFTAPLRESKTGQELSTDLLVKGYGIQVKNYKEHNRVYSLSKSYKSWETIESKLQNDGNLQEIGKFLATQSYNKVIDPILAKDKDGWESYNALYQNTMAPRRGSATVGTQAYFMAHAGDFFSFEEAKQLVTGNLEIDEHKNLFYMFGGTTLVPTSYIIRLLCNRIDQILKMFQATKDRESLNVFSFTNSYKSDIVWNYEYVKPR